MLRVGKNLIVNEAHIVKAELRSLEPEMVVEVTLSIPIRHLHPSKPYLDHQIELKGDEAEQMWEHLTGVRIGRDGKEQGRSVSGFSR